MGVGGNVSIGILRAIKNSNIDAYVLGACVQKYAAGFSFCDTSLICPNANDKKFFQRRIGIGWQQISYQKWQMIDMKCLLTALKAKEHVGYFPEHDLNDTIDWMLKS